MRSRRGPSNWVSKLGGGDDSRRCLIVIKSMLPDDLKRTGLPIGCCRDLRSGALSNGMFLWRSAPDLRRRAAGDEDVGARRSCLLLECICPGKKMGFLLVAAGSWSEPMKETCRRLDLAVVDARRPSRCCRSDRLPGLAVKSLPDGSKWRAAGDGSSMAAGFADLGKMEHRNSVLRQCTYNRAHAVY
ncbi:hypothetical protein ACLOJK_036575 [Asimina triloba]